MSELLSPSIFSKILSREIPWVILCTSKTCFSILTNKQAQAWHALILPKRWITELEDMNSEEIGEFWIITALVSEALKKVFEVPKVWLLRSWFEISHYHQHLIPVRAWKDISIQEVTEVSLSERRKQWIDIQEVLRIFWSQYKWVDFSLPENS